MLARQEGVEVGRRETEAAVVETHLSNCRLWIGRSLRNTPPMSGAETARQGLAEAVKALEERGATVRADASSHSKNTLRVQLPHGDACATSTSRDSADADTWQTDVGKPDPSRPRPTSPDGDPLRPLGTPLYRWNARIALFASIRRGASLRLVVGDTNDAGMISHAVANDCRCGLVNSPTLARIRAVRPNHGIACVDGPHASAGCCSDIARLGSTAVTARTPASLSVDEVEDMRQVALTRPRLQAASCIMQVYVGRQAEPESSPTRLASSGAVASQLSSPSAGRASGMYRVKCERHKLHVHRLKQPVRLTSRSRLAVSPRSQDLDSGERQRSAMEDVEPEAVRNVLNSESGHNVCIVRAVAKKLATPPKPAQRMVVRGADEAGGRRVDEPPSNVILERHETQVRPEIPVAGLAAR